MHLSICTAAHPCSVEHRCPAARSIRILGSFPRGAREHETGRRRAARVLDSADQYCRTEGGGGGQQAFLRGFLALDAAIFSGWYK